MEHKAYGIFKKEVFDTSTSNKNYLSHPTASTAPNANIYILSHS
jgi:hypothetical protein